VERRSLSSYLIRHELQRSRALASPAGVVPPSAPTVDWRSSAHPRSTQASWIETRELPALRTSLQGWIAAEPQTPSYRPLPPPLAPHLNIESRNTQGTLLRTGTGPDAFVPVAQVDRAPEKLEEPEPVVEPRLLPTGPLPAFLPTLAGMAIRIRAELQGQLDKLMTLNRSRREAIVRYLEQLAGVAQSSLHQADDREVLQAWVSQTLPPAKAQALQAYLEEVVWVCLGQILLLKNWNDRAIRPLRNKDLCELNWVLCDALRRFQPLDRDGWQLVRQNLYSWYSPSVSLCQELWRALESFRLDGESPDLIIRLLRHVRESTPEWAELRGYDSRFYAETWRAVEQWGFDSRPDQSVLKRSKTVFCPTLRDGALARPAPAAIQWAALENLPFPLMCAELALLWEGPATPPLWTQGVGLEVHPRDQLSLSLAAVKPTSISRIAEMDACDLAIILEERPVRLSGRGVENQRIRAMVDQLPYFKKLKEPGATLGDLQAAVALAKLRPGAMLVWFREEPLGQQDGTEVLRWILDRGKLLAEIDLSQIRSRVLSQTPLFPRYGYVLKRDLDHQSRPLHVPHRVIALGEITSHVEVEQLLRDTFTAVTLPEHARTRAHWKIVVQKGATPQKEWIEHWPTQTDHEALVEIDRLKASGAPLATICTVRPAAGAILPKGARTRGAIWIRAEKDSDGRRYLHVEVLGGTEPRGPEVPQGTGGLVVIGPTDEWTAPLAEYLRSSAVCKWIDHHADRKGDRWVLSEQVVKFIPIPRNLADAISNPLNWSGERLPLEWRAALEKIDFAPRELAHLVDLLEKSSAPTAAAALRMTAFIHASQARARVAAARARMKHLVNDSSDIKWCELLRILPTAELLPATLHPQVQLLGQIPQQVPIVRIARVKTPRSGLLLVTESGFQTQINSENPRIMDLLEAQLKQLEHPTWAEVTQFLKLPRRIEMAETAAHEILLSHGEQLVRLKELDSILAKTGAF
jgi:hypothetical protein